MALHVALTHRTAYQYDRRIGMGPQVIRLRPAPTAGRRSSSYSLTVEPKTHFINWQQDPFGNFLARVVFPRRPRFRLTSISWPTWRSSTRSTSSSRKRQGLALRIRDQTLAKELAPYLEPEPAGSRSTAISAASTSTNSDTLDFLCDLNRELQNEIGYVIRMEPGVQTPEETLRKRPRLVPRQRAGCWCRSCAISALPRASSRAI